MRKTQAPRRVQISDPFPNYPLREAADAIYYNDVKGLFIAASTMLTYYSRKTQGEVSLLGPALLSAKKLIGAGAFDESLKILARAQRLAISVIDHAEVRRTFDIMVKKATEEGNLPVAQKALGLSMEPFKAYTNDIVERTDSLVAMGFQALHKNEAKAAMSATLGAFAHFTDHRPALLLSLSIIEQVQNHGDWDTAQQVAGMVMVRADMVGNETLSTYARALAAWVRSPNPNEQERPLPPPTKILFPQELVEDDADQALADLPPVLPAAFEAPARKPVFLAKPQAERESPRMIKDKQDACRSFLRTFASLPFRRAEP